MGKKSALDSEKRQVPAALQTLLSADVYVTKTFCNCVELVLPFKAFQNKYKALEISCHGIPWLAGWLAYIWIWNSPNLYQMQVNFFVGLILDIIVVAVIKSLTRRRRPILNQSDMFATVSMDKFSFPSGHATRACFIAHFFAYIYPVPVVLQFAFIFWAGIISISRVLLHRHHVLDVLSGAIIGVMESVAVGYIWFSQGTCLWLLSVITDEKLDGGEYHV